MDLYVLPFPELLYDTFCMSPVVPLCTVAFPSAEARCPRGGVCPGEAESRSGLPWQFCLNLCWW